MDAEPEAPTKVYTVLTDSLLLSSSLWIKRDCPNETRAASGKTNFIVTDCMRWDDAICERYKMEQRRVYFECNWEVRAVLYISKN